MTNLGIAPADVSTTIGMARTLIGDTHYVDVVPAIAGQGSYDRFSDGDIAVFLIQGQSNPMVACGYAYLQMAAALALTSVNLATNDLKIDNTKRVDQLRLIAESWFDRANASETLSLGDSSSTQYDLRDFLYPTGIKIASDIIWTDPAITSGLGLTVIAGIS